MATILEQYKILVLYFMNFSLQLLRIVSETKCAGSCFACVAMPYHCHFHQHQKPRYWFWSSNKLNYYLLVRKLLCRHQ